MDTRELHHFLLRIGMATVFLYAGIASLLEPAIWSSFLPSWLGSIVPFKPVLVIFSIYELILGCWLLTRWKTFYAAILASITLIAIVLVNITALDIVFRDIAILFASLALVALDWPERRRKK